MPSEALSVIEAKITVKKDKLSIEVSGGNAGGVKAIADELLALTEDRNRRCKQMKG